MARAISKHAGPGQQAHPLDSVRRIIAVGPADVAFRVVAHHVDLLQAPGATCVAEQRVAMPQQQILRERVRLRVRFPDDGLVQFRRRGVGAVRVRGDGAPETLERLAEAALPEPR